MELLGALGERKVLSQALAPLWTHSHGMWAAIRSTTHSRDSFLKKVPESGHGWAQVGSQGRSKVYGKLGAWGGAGGNGGGFWGED